jgi:hypothetical protein
MNIDFKGICHLDKKTFEICKRNPHCIQHFCSVSNIFLNKNKETYYFKYTRTFKETSLITDKSFENKLKGTIKNFFNPYLIKSIKTYIPRTIEYRARGQRPSTTLHIGQLKLFIEKI